MDIQVESDSASFLDAGSTPASSTKRTAEGSVMKNELVRIIEKNGGVLVRSKRHNVFKMPDGKIVVVSQSPSDKRASKNLRSWVKRWKRSGNDG